MQDVNNREKYMGVESEGGYGNFLYFPGNFSVYTKLL